MDKIENNTTKEEFNEEILASSDDIGTINTDEKISPDDESLKLPTEKKINKKHLKLIFIIFGVICFIAMMLGRKSLQGEAEDEAENTRTNMPNLLKVTDSDYLNRVRYEDAIVEDALIDMNGNEIQNEGDYTDGYNSYDRRDEYDLIIREPEQDPEQKYYNDPYVYRNDNSYNNFNDDIGERKASLFFDTVVLPPENYNTNEKSEYDYLIETAELQNLTEYELQNMQRQKEEFFNNYGADLSNYLVASYSYPIEPEKTIMAGTIVPYILLTGINSDLPGQIIAQVSMNVYNTVTGRNILIPRGSRIIGSYDSSVCFGQERVLIMFDRIIFPNGGSINLLGMPGCDLQGVSGMKDIVDHHIGDIIKTLAISSAFDIAKDAAVSWISSIEFFSSLSETLENKNETINNIAEKIAEMKLNQQPTIEIRAGMRGNIFINKDMVLPIYRSSGY